MASCTLPKLMRSDMVRDRGWRLVNAPRPD
jgi:hypothetical protein